jgi:hypothetical protein
MKLALTCYRTIEVLGKKETNRLGDEIFPLVDGVEIGVKDELVTVLRNCCCPYRRKVCQYCIAYSKFKIPLTFKLHFKDNKGMFGCRNSNHPSIYINGGSLENKLELGKEFEIGVGTIIYMREPGGNRDDIKMEFHVVAIDENEKEIVVEKSTGSTTIEPVDIIHNVDATVATAIVTAIDVDVDADAEFFDISTPKSLMGKTIIAATPINTVTFALPVDNQFLNEATPSLRSAPDPPESTKKLIIQKDPTGKSPKFRMQSPPPIRSPLPVKVNKDEESWLQEQRLHPCAKQIDYSTVKKCKKD